MQAVATCAALLPGQGVLHAIVALGLSKALLVSSWAPWPWLDQIN